MWYVKFLAAICTLAVFAGLGEAHAQGLEGGRSANGSGVVVALDLQNMQILVSDGGGGQVILDFNSNRDVNGIPNNMLTPATSRVTGVVPRAALERGLTVRVTGKVNARQEFVDPIQALTVTGVGVNPVDTYGFFPAPELTITEEEAEQGVQGVVVSGLIARIRGTSIIITAPTGTGETVSFDGELEEEAVITVDSADYRLASPGDQANFDGITFDGRSVFPMRVTFTKQAPDQPAAPEPAPAFGGERQPFGGDMPEDGQGAGIAPAQDQPAAEAGDQPMVGDAASPDESAEPAVPAKPGRVVRIN